MQHILAFRLAEMIICGTWVRTGPAEPRLDTAFRKLKGGLQRWDTASNDPKVHLQPKYSLDPVQYKEFRSTHTAQRPWSNKIPE